MLTAENTILALKIAVSAVTVLLLASFVALLRGNIRLHGRINTVFFILTISALVGLEVVAPQPPVYQTQFGGHLGRPPRIRLATRRRQPRKHDSDCLRDQADLSLAGDSQLDEGS